MKGKWIIASWTAPSTFFCYIFIATRFAINAITLYLSVFGMPRLRYEPSREQLLAQIPTRTETKVRVAANIF